MKFIGLMTIVVLLISAPTIVLAQDEGPGYVDIRILTVKPDQVGQWESLIKERSEAVQEGGWAFYHVYQRVRGPLNTYLSVRPFGAVGEPGRAIDERPTVPVSENWLTALLGTLVSNGGIPFTQVTPTCCGGAPSSGRARLGRSPCRALGPGSPPVGGAGRRACPDGVRLAG